MKVLRSVAKYVLIDTIKVRKYVRGELLINNLRYKIKETSRKWIDHLDRQPPSNTARKVLHYTAKNVVSDGQRQDGLSRTCNISGTGTALILVDNKNLFKSLVVY